MSLKRERSRRRTENRPLFETIYSIDGKVFVKLTRGAPNQEAVNIKTPSMMEDFISKLDTGIID